MCLPVYLRHSFKLFNNSVHFGNKFVSAIFNTEILRMYHENITKNGSHSLCTKMLTVV